MCKCYVFKRIVPHEVLSNASLLPKKKKSYTTATVVSARENVHGERNQGE